MQKPTLNLLALSIGLVSVSSAGGWFIIRKIASTSAAQEFLWLAIASCILILCTQSIAFGFAKRGLYYLLLFLASLGLSMAWFVLCFFLPILWLEGVTWYAKLVLMSVLALLSISNFNEALRRFERHWSGLEEPLSLGRFDAGKNTIDWERIMGAVKYSADLFIPGVPQKVTSILSVVMVVSMVVGFSLRSAYPVFSAFAWGVPSALLTSLVVQLVGLNYTQARKVQSLQKGMGITLKSRF